jgi:hypothetical protein
VGGGTAHSMGEELGATGSSTATYDEEVTVLNRKRDELWRDVLATGESQGFGEADDLEQHYRTLARTGSDTSINATRSRADGKHEPFCERRMVEFSLVERCSQCRDEKPRVVINEYLMVNRVWKRRPSGGG